jgi:hypothetical protein
MSKQGDSPSKGARENKREQGRDLRKGNRDWKAGVFNIPLLLAIEVNTQLKVGIGGKALFLYKKAMNNGMLHLPMFRGCNRCWYTIGSMVTTTER